MLLGSLSVPRQGGEVSVDWGTFPDAALRKLRSLLDRVDYASLAPLPWFGMRYRCPFHDAWVERRMAKGIALPLACHSRPSRFTGSLPTELQRVRRLFWLHEEIDDQEGCEELLEAGLLRKRDGKLSSLVQIVSLAGGRYVMGSVPDLSPGEFVYLGDDTGRLLEEVRLRGARGGRFLDLCCGGGGVSLGCGPDFSTVTGLDLNPNGIALARSNAILNGRPDYEYRVSNLFESAHGTYDWIVGNPPALPTISRATMFAYGGNASTDLTQRLLEELPTYLAAGGQALLLTFSPAWRLWDIANRVLPRDVSLDYRVVARFHPGLPDVSVLDHVMLAIHRDGKGTRIRQNPTPGDRLRQLRAPFLQAEKLVPRLPSG